MSLEKITSLTENKKYFIKVNVSVFLFSLFLLLLESNFNLIYVLVFYFLIYILGFNFAHRSICHKEFELTDFGKTIIGFLTIFMMLGDAIQFSRTHRFHHQYADTVKDPHSPSNGYFHAFVGWLFKDTDIKISFKYVKDLIKDPVLLFFMKHQIKIIWITLLSISLISLEISLSLSIAMLLSWTVEMTCSAFIDHSKKEKMPRNVILRDYLTLSPAHRTHHEIPYKTPDNDPAIFLIQLSKLLGVSK